MRRTIDPLTGVRGIAAAWVVIAHMYFVIPVLLPTIPFLGHVLDAGTIGVDMFFVLSGFVITYTYLDRIGSGRPGETRRYLWLRVARIYPAHLVTLLLMAALVAGSYLLGTPPEGEAQFTPFSFVMNLLLLQAVPPALAWNNPAWSISTEFIAYLVFPLFVPLISRLSARVALLWITVLLVVGVVGIGAIVYTGDAWPYWAGYALMWARIAIAFPVGCLLYLVWRSRPLEQWRRPGGLLLVVAVIGIAAAVVVTPPAPAPGRPLTLPVLAYPFLALLVFGLATSTGRIARFLSRRTLVWAGLRSYSMYLIHFPILVVVSVMVKRWGVEQGSALSWIVLVVTLGLCVGGAELLYRFVEEPGRGLIKRYAERGATARPPAQMQPPA